MTNPRTFHLGADRLCCHAWNTHPATVILQNASTHPITAPASIRTLVNALLARGVERILTPPLDESAGDAFVQAGFVVHERLNVLHHDLHDHGNQSSCRVRNGKNVSRAVAIDHAAFGNDHCLDAHGLHAAMRATPIAQLIFARRFRSNDFGGYALCAVAGTQGYLQRLAVHPHDQRNGIGTALVDCALRWCAKNGATNVLVNTETTNQGAERLYRKLGFVAGGDWLTVYRNGDTECRLPA